MKRKKPDCCQASFTEDQIVRILKEYEGGRATKEICRDYSISQATFYNWKKKYGGMDASQLKRLKELEEENQKLKQMPVYRQVDTPMLPMISECLRMCFQKSSEALLEKAQSQLSEKAARGEHKQGMLANRIASINGICSRVV